MKRTLRRLLVLCGFIILSGGLLPALVSAAGPWQLAFSAAGQAISDGQYWNLVESSHRAVTTLKGAPADKIEAGLTNLATQWQAFSAVTLADGETVQIDNSYLLTALTARQPNLDEIEHILRSLETAHKTYPSHVFTAADLESLKQILAHPEFRGLNQPANPLREWLQHLWTRLVKWFSDLLQRIFGNRSVTLQSGEWSPLAVLSVAILILVLIYAVRSIFADFISEANLNENGNGFDKALTSDSAFERAQSLSRDGEYRSAVRYLYLSCLLLLDERGLLRYDHSKTNREVLRSVSDSPELAGPLQDVVEVFDNVWYGYHTLDEESFRHYSERVEELKEKRK